MRYYLGLTAALAISAPAMAQVATYDATGVVPSVSIMCPASSAKGAALAPCTFGGGGGGGTVTQGPQATGAAGNTWFVQVPSLDAIISGGKMAVSDAPLLAALGSPFQAGGAVSVAGTVAISAASLPLPTGAATAAGLATINTTLGTPLQAGGAVSVSNLPAVQSVIIANQSTGITPVVSTTAEAFHVIKASAGSLYAWRVTTGASAGYVLILNATSDPGNGAVTPLDCVQVAANATTGSSAAIVPEAFGTGIVIEFSTTGCFTLTKSATAYIKGDAF